MKAHIREKIAAVLAKPDPSSNVGMHTPEVFVEMADLEKRIAVIMGQLPKKEWFTPKEVGQEICRCDSWVRHRFQENPHCFNLSNGSKVYLAIPRDVLEAELRSMYRCRIRL